MNSRKIFIILFSFYIFLAPGSIYSIRKSGNIKPVQGTSWSKLMTDTFIFRHPSGVSYDSVNPKWDYEQGVMLHAIWGVYKKTGNEKYFDYIKHDVDYYLSGDSVIKTYDPNKFRLDDIMPGRTVLDLYETGKDFKYKQAAGLLREQLRKQPRTPEGGLWHKKIYPEQMWLDGLYMAEPFYIKYAKIFNEPEDFRDITKQFMLMAKHGRDQKTGLFYHGWDFSKKQKWADKKTGTSPTLWGRAMGWYLMGLVDVLEYLPRSNPDRPKLISILKDFCKSLIKFQDKRSCLWYQVVDKPGKDGNYLESSASSMFMYVFAKGANNGYLDKKYLTDAYDIFENLKNKMIVKGADGRPSLINTCAGAGLGGEPYRDGSYSYYISVPKSTDDFKGLGPFIMGCLELEKASDLNADTSSQSERGKVVGLDYFFNNEWIKDKNGNETRYHYIWEDTANTGYSKLGIIIKNLNAELKEITVAPVRNNLDELSIYIIVDPDTPQETPHPNYIDDVSITNIVNWVKKGGVLVLFGNDKGNCEFEHLNKLAGNFGIHFNEDSRNRVTGTNFDIGKFDNLPVHPVFKDVKQIFLKEISTLRIHKPAKFILKDNGDVIMASAELGKGFVFAVGDPWFYNEYIDNRKLPVDFENYKAAKNLFYWLLGKAKQVD